MRYKIITVLFILKLASILNRVKVRMLCNYILHSCCTPFSLACVWSQQGLDVRSAVLSCCVSVILNVFRPFLRVWDTLTLPARVSALVLDRQAVTLYKAPAGLVTIGAQNNTGSMMGPGGPNWANAILMACIVNGFFPVKSDLDNHDLMTSDTEGISFRSWLAW